MQVIELQYGMWSFRWMGGSFHSFPTKDAAEEALRIMLKTANEKPDFRAPPGSFEFD